MKVLFAFMKMIPALNLQFEGLAMKYKIRKEPFVAVRSCNQYPNLGENLLHGQFTKKMGTKKGY